MEINLYFFYAISVKTPKMFKYTTVAKTKNIFVYKLSVDFRGKLSSLKFDRHLKLIIEIWDRIHKNLFSL